MTVNQTGKGEVYYLWLRSDEKAMKKCWLFIWEEKQGLIWIYIKLMV